jgi:hypothetical protein
MRARALDGRTTLAFLLHLEEHLMADSRRPLATARSYLFSYHDGRLRQSDRKRAFAALGALKNLDHRAWEVLQDAHVYKREDIDWRDEEEAITKLADLLAASAALGLRWAQQLPPCTDPQGGFEGGR